MGKSRKVKRRVRAQPPVFGAVVLTDGPIAPRRVPKHTVLKMKCAWPRGTFKERA